MSDVDSKNLIMLTDKDDFSRLIGAKHDLAPLEAGKIRVKIGPFALTANNITYMVTGDQIGYWKFFDPSVYGLEIADEDMSRLGAMPVWGYGVITQSKCEKIKAGQRLYGFFPPARFLDISPVAIRSDGFQDGAKHRAALHPVYNNYRFTDGAADFPTRLEDIQPILRPLFTTSFLIDDFMADNSFFGAKQIILLSASSKTALGTAFCLSRRTGIKVMGLTSTRNVDFVESTGFYDSVHAYDDPIFWNKNIPTVLVDMAGDGAVTAKLYKHFDEKIVYNCMVGKSHWEGAAPARPKLGAPPVMFFAPDRARIRFADWGADGFTKRLAQGWLPFCDSAQNWLTISRANGLDGFWGIYGPLLAGTLSPQKGCLVTL